MAYSVPSCLERKHLEVFAFGLLFHREKARFISFGALGECAYFHSVPSPTALTFIAHLLLAILSIIVLRPLFILPIQFLKTNKETVVTCFFLLFQPIKKMRKTPVDSMIILYYSTSYLYRFTTHVHLQNVKYLTYMLSA